jgi:UDP-3-O-acyl-N-acetylglucosamine deacetylase
LAVSYHRFERQPVDQEWMPPLSAPPAAQTTIGTPVEVTGPGTFLGAARRTMRFEPYDKGGWWLERADLPLALPIHVSVVNVWTTVRNIVLCCGSPHNYMRMVEHIVALRLGMNIDSLLIKITNGDPPLFERGSLDLVEAFDRAGVRALDRPVSHVTVREPVAMVNPNGSFLLIKPARPGVPALDIDCAVDFPSAIGCQRLRVRVTPDTFRHGAVARTNCPLSMMVYAATLGKLFADVRNLGYNRRNILIAGRKRYFNAPRLNHNGKALEAVWHRAMLDLLAAIALIDRGRFVGEIISYKAGHTLDVDMVRLLYKHNLLVELPA